MTLARRSGRTMEVIATLGLFVLALAMSPGVAAAGTISPELEAVMRDKSPYRRIPVVIRLQAQADLQAAVANAQSKAHRVRAVIQALKQNADATQNEPVGGRPGLLDELAQAGPSNARDVRPFWAANAVTVSARADVIHGCAARSDIAEIAFGGPFVAVVPEIVAEEVQDNIARVRAPEVWQLGFIGNGMVIGAIDTGANPAHPNLTPNLLYGAGGLPVWHDAIRGRPAPYDDEGHGSHVIGIAVGQDGIGVAPGASWIACKAFRRNRRGTIRATAAAILECAQWVLNPDEPNLADPAHVPDIVVNSWWLGDAGECDAIGPFQDFVRAWRLAGILPVFAVGDDPMGMAPEDAVPSPANYPEAFSTGAAGTADEQLPSSFRGTADCGGTARSAPRLLAPGVDILSAGRGRGLDSRDGTGTAAPHAAGAAALLREAFPQLTLKRVDEILQRSARDFLPGPDPSYRAGLLDVYNAVTLEDAVFVGQSPPMGTRTTGETVPVSVTLRNAGVTTWIGGVHRLVAINPNDARWGVQCVDLPNATAPPDALVSFAFNVTVPNVPNLSPGYNFQWRMIHDPDGGTCTGEFFGDSPPPFLVSVRGYNDAVFVSPQTFPSGLQPGSCGWASLTFRNTGTNSWTRGGSYRLGSQNPQDNSTWGVNRVELLQGEVIPPGGEKRFDFVICAPPVQGCYDFQWRMVQDGVEWLGQFSPNVHACPEGTDLSNLCGLGVPGELRIGQPATVSVCMSNKGTNAWINGYCLSSRDGSFWGTANVCLTPTERILRDQNRNFIFGIVGPNQPGRWTFDYQMRSDDGVLFGEVTAPTIGVPLDYQASACFSSTQGDCQWVYRYYDASITSWRKMHFVTDHWEGSGNWQRIWPNAAHPGDGVPIARFWVSPVTGTVRVTGEVHDLDGGCGDGIVFRIRKNKGNGSLLHETTVYNGDSSPHWFNVTKDVEVNDTIRFIVKPRSNNNCDTTHLDPLVQILPPGMVGPIVPQSTYYAEVESGDPE